MKTISVRLTDEDLKEIDVIMNWQKKQGFTQCTRSDAIRMCTHLIWADLTYNKKNAHVNNYL